MPQPVKAIPDGFHTITPSLVVEGAAEAIEFYKKAFGAEELSRSPGPDGKKIMHAELKIGNSILFLNDEFKDMNCRSPKTLGGTPVALHLYVEDVDMVFDRAIKAGGKAQMPVMDMFWGDRYGKFVDPFGQEWSIATRKENLSPEEMGKRAMEAFAKMGNSPGCGS